MNGQTLGRGIVGLPGRLTAVYTPSGLAEFRHPDGLGSARLTTTPARIFNGSQAYGAYGESYAAAGSADPSYTGHDPDTVGDLYDTWFRRYSPRQGRWLSPDPAGTVAVDPSNPQSLNRYAYVANNPLILLDPLGLICTTSFTAGNLSFSCTVWGSLYGGGAGGDHGKLVAYSDDTDRPSGNDSGFTLGIRAPGQTYQQCLAANAHTYSAGGAIELAVNVATGTNTSFSSNKAVDFFTGNVINSVLFGDAKDAGLAAAGQAPGVLEAGVGTGLTYGRRTSGSLALNLAGKGGLPQALSSSTGGLRSVLGRVGNVLNLGLKASTRFGIDLGLTGAEAIGCAIPQS
ncbi:MAG: RHS repeat-associated core domain-containing protein [Terriglobales bacterium]